MTQKPLINAAVVSSCPSAHADFLSNRTWDGLSAILGFTYTTEASITMDSLWTEPSNTHEVTISRRMAEEEARTSWTWAYKDHSGQRLPSYFAVCPLLVALALYAHSKEKKGYRKKSFFVSCVTAVLVFRGKAPVKVI